MCAVRQQAGLGSCDPPTTWPWASPLAPPASFLSCKIKLTEGASEGPHGGGKHVGLVWGKPLKETSPPDSPPSPCGFLCELPVTKLAQSSDKFIVLRTVERIPLLRGWPSTPLLCTGCVGRCCETPQKSPYHRAWHTVGPQPRGAPLL